MPAQLPGMLWRVVINNPPGRESRVYVDPTSKNFANKQHALNYQERAVNAGLRARPFVTSCDWIESVQV